MELGGTEMTISDGSVSGCSCEESFVVNKPFCSTIEDLRYLSIGLSLLHRATDTQPNCLQTPGQSTAQGHLIQMSSLGSYKERRDSTYWMGGRRSSQGNLRTRGSVQDGSHWKGGWNGTAREPPTMCAG